jgi:hypothetical protein
VRFATPPELSQTSRNSRNSPLLKNLPKLKKIHPQNTSSLQEACCNLLITRNSTKPYSEHFQPSYSPSGIHILNSILIIGDFLYSTTLLPAALPSRLSIMRTLSFSLSLSPFIHVDIHVSISLSLEMLLESYYVKRQYMPGGQVTRLRLTRQAAGCWTVMCLCLKPRMKATALKSENYPLALGLRGPPFRTSHILSPLTQDLPDKLDTD